MIKRQVRIERQVRLRKCLDVLMRGEDVSDAEAALGTDIDTQMISDLLETAGGTEFPVNMRIYLLLSDLCRDNKITSFSAADFEDMAYETIKSEIIEATNKKHIFKRSSAHYVTDNVTVEMPVRVNFCGSPSDAAPYCLEHGGTMLDAAIALNGKKPVKATVTKLDRPVFLLESLDQGEAVEIFDINEIRACGDPFDKFALLKAAIVSTGLISVTDDGRTLEEVCHGIGGGLRLATSADVPKGSGLGTSSIIAAAGIKAVNTILGQDTGDDCIYAQVFLAEQLMNTGGGWQDQVGGYREGVKYFTSQPGIYQKIDVQDIELTAGAKKELNDRFALIFSGQRRLARNVLREEMNQCIRNAPEALDAVAKIQEYCALMKFYLEKGNITAFAGYLSRQFELVKLLDKGASNTCIEYIFSVCGDLIDGKCICGAGGGGFLQVILKKGVSRDQLEARIDKEFSGCGVKVWDANILF